MTNAFGIVGLVNTFTASVGGVLNRHHLSPSLAIIYYFSLLLVPGDNYQVMREMLGKNMRQNLQMVVQISSAYSDQIGAENLIEMLESFKLYEGLFYYLGAIVNNSTVCMSSARVDVFHTLDTECSPLGRVLRLIFS